MKHFKNNISVTKASGRSEPFDIEKLIRSLSKSGANKDEINAVIKEIEPFLHPGIKTKKIYKLAYKILRNIAKPVAGKYKLKAAIMELGPSGYPFERFVAAILNHQGFVTQTGVIVQGKCVKHEIDVIAEKDDKHFMIECKYHNQLGTVSDVKIPLYINSRFKDVEASWVKLPGHDVKLHQGWVVTNTKFSSDAIQYGNCAGLHLVGWDYPHKNSLNVQIERLGLYPITCLTTLTKSEKHRLLENKIVLCSEICANPIFLKDAGVSDQRMNSVLNEGKSLCQSNSNHFHS